MKRISDELKSDIEDASTAGIIGNLPPIVIEKDIHITDALFELSKIRIEHIAYQQKRLKDDPNPSEIKILTQLIFAGGTCLSKVHGLIERMSEDIDIKVILDPIPDGYLLAKGASNRKRLKDLHENVKTHLEKVGFYFDKEQKSEVILDNRRYYCISLSYFPKFQDISGALRAQLKLEFIHRHTKLPVRELEMGYLLDKFIPNKSPFRFSILSISVSETLAEKVLSFLRRCAWKLGGYQRGEFDSTLVRHIYDVWCIFNNRPDSIIEAKAIFADLVKEDIEEFKGQNPTFDKEPYQILNNTLEMALNNESFHKELFLNFEQRLKPLLFAENKPNFDICFKIFYNIAFDFIN